MTSNTAGRWLTTLEFAMLAGVGRSVASRALAAQRWRGASIEVRSVHGAGGEAGQRYEVRLTTLPVELQIAWARHAAPPRAAAPSLTARAASSATGRWTAEDRAARHLAFTRLPTSLQDRAKRAFRAVFDVHLSDEMGIRMFERCAQAAERAGVHVKTVQRWVEMCEGLDPSDWLIALAPDYKGGLVSAAIAPEIYDYIKGEFFTEAKPSLRPIYRRAKRLASEKGWALPSYDTVNRLVKNEPRSLHVLKRSGLDALARLYPPQRRDYSTLGVMELWCSDGRKADVFVRWENGDVSRPIIVAWEDLRSRYCVGYIVGRTESADLIRLAFKNAAERSRVIPQAVLIDNGRGFAAKLLTGGVPNRYRFKVREEDIPGIFPLLGIKVSWALPFNARSKPIESWWRVIAESDKRFVGAYCGNRPDARPEDCDPSRAIPIEQYRAAVAETIAEYNMRPHRGHAMHGRSPHEVLNELLPGTAVRQPTPEQLRLCLLAAGKVRLDPQDGSVRWFGNVYWQEGCADLPTDRDYDIRGNPEDSTEPVYIYDGDRFILEAPMIARTGFRDQQAAKDYARGKRQFVGERKRRAAALKLMNDASAWSPKPDAPKPLHAQLEKVRALPKIVSPVRPVRDYRPGKPARTQITVRPEVQRAFVEKYTKFLKKGGG